MSPDPPPPSLSLSLSLSLSPSLSLSLALSLSRSLSLSLALSLSLSLSLSLFSRHPLLLSSFLLPSLSSLRLSAPFFSFFSFLFFVARCLLLVCCARVFSLCPLSPSLFSLPLSSPHPPLLFSLTSLSIFTCSPCLLSFLPCCPPCFLYFPFRCPPPCFLFLLLVCSLSSPPLPVFSPSSPVLAVFIPSSPALLLVFCPSSPCPVVDL